MCTYKDLTVRNTALAVGLLKNRETFEMLTLMSTIVPLNKRTGKKKKCFIWVNLYLLLERNPSGSLDYIVCQLLCH
jgi:hypothetical protein